MAMKSQASKSFSRNAKQLLGLLILFSFSSNSAVQAVSISLPTKLTSLSIAKVDCFIDSTVDLPIGCFLSMSVEFFFKNSSVNTLLCQTAYDGPVLSEVVGDMNCGMVTSSSEERTFRLNFKGDRASHEGGTLTCSISCTQVSTSSSKSSGPLKFSVTTVSETESTCSDGCKAGIGIAVVLVVICGGYTARKRYIRVTTMVEVIE